MHAVVLVSGGTAVTPFTTPDAAARSGLAAGNSLTALRAHFLARGRAVFTTPARVGPGEVHEDAEWEGFSDAPIVLPAELTADSIGTIDGAGASIARAMAHILEHYEVTRLDVVGHSMGGLFARAAFRHAQERGEALPVRRFVTLGTPWTGSLAGALLTGELSEADAGGDPVTERILAETRAYSEAYSPGLARQASRSFLAGPDGWNARQAGVLDGIEVSALGGNPLAAHAAPASLWPHDGLVALASALAAEVPPEVVTVRRTAVFPDVHSIFVANALGLPWERALTWDPEVFETLDAILGC